MSIDFKDLAERVISTFVGAAIVALPASATDLLELSTWQAVGLAGAAAVVSFLKGLVASQTGPTNGGGLGT